MRCTQSASSYLACLLLWLYSVPKPWEICRPPAPPATTAASHGPWAPHPTSATPSLSVHCNGVQLTPAAPSNLPGSSIPSHSLQARPKPQTAWPTPLSPLDAPSPPPQPTHHYHHPPPHLLPADNAQLGTALPQQLHDASVHISQQALQCVGRLGDRGLAHTVICLQAGCPTHACQSGALGEWHQGTTYM